MTDRELLAKVKQIINENSTWVVAEDDSYVKIIYVPAGYGMIPYPSRHLVLRSVVRTRNIRPGKRWYISDYAIREIYEKCFHGKSLEQLTRYDVENIIHKASGDSIRLCLREFIL